MAKAMTSCHGCTKRWVDPETMTRCHSTCPDYASDIKNKPMVAPTFTEEQALANERSKRIAKAYRRHR